MVEAGAMEAGAVDGVATEGAAAEPVAAEAVAEPTFEVVDGVKTPLPIAVSGDLKIMPPATGLPTAQQAAGRNGGLHGLLDAADAVGAAETTETTAHGN